jgi:hypothetical protein
MYLWSLKKKSDSELDPDLDPVVRGTVRIRGAGSGSAPKCFSRRIELYLS